LSLSTSLCTALCQATSALPFNWNQLRPGDSIADTRGEPAGVPEEAAALRQQQEGPGRRQWRSCGLTLLLGVGQPEPLGGWLIEVLTYHILFPGSRIHSQSSPEPPTVPKRRHWFLAGGCWRFARTSLPSGNVDSLFHGDHFYHGDT
jgi:hypothetical protein